MKWIKAKRVVGHNTSDAIVNLSNVEAIVCCEDNTAAVFFMGDEMPMFLNEPYDTFIARVISDAREIA